jgi:enoyl-CoA hydratase/carnithine racemase
MFELSVHGRVAVLTLCRAPVNAMSAEWVAAFHGHLDELDARDDWSVLHVRSAQKIFCAGADLRQLHENFGRDMESQLDLGRSYQKLFQRVQDLPAVTLAELGGATLGGGLELALACDLRVTAPKVKFGFPEVTLGLIPGAGGTQRLTRLCGLPAASRLILTGEIIDGMEAHRIGIAQWCVESDRVADTAAQLAQRCAAFPRFATAGAKSAIHMAADAGGSGFSRETEVVRACFESAETRGLVATFLKK